MATSEDKFGLFRDTQQNERSPADPPASVERSPAPFWSATLTQRQRVLLHVVPLQELRNGDALRDRGAHYDTLALALKTFDVIIDHTGFGAQVNRDLLCQHIVPLLRAMDDSAGVTPDSKRYDDTVDRVIASLRNDPNGRRPFAFEYQDFGKEGQSIRRVLEFRLLTEEYGLDGSIVLVLTSEAINLYLRAFDLEIEDAQIANEAVVQSQIERGKFNEAIESAQNARLQSIRYHDRINKLLQQTRRDVDRVDWRRDMPELLSSALQHVEGRLNTERAILLAAEGRREEFPAGSDRVIALLEVIRLMKDCQHRHLALHGQLMRARGDFLEQQARQSFSPDLMVQPVDLLEAVLQPALMLPRDQGHDLCNELLPFLCGAVPRPVLSVKDLIEWHLRPRRPLPMHEIPVDPPDLADRGLDVPRFTIAMSEETSQILAGVRGRARLSSLLIAMEEQGAMRESQELLVMRVLHMFAPEDGLIPTARVHPLNGEELNVHGFYGDDLLLHGAGGDHGIPPK